MRKNPFSRLINHKILHKVGKQWVILSASIIFLLTGASLATNVHVNASRVKPSVTQQRQLKSSKPNLQNKIQTYSESAKQPNHVISFRSNGNVQNNNVRSIRTQAKHLHQNLIMNAMKVNHKIINHRNGKQVITAYHRSTHKRRYYKNHRHFIKTSRNGGRKYYINTDRRDNQYGIPYGQLGYFKKDNSDEYPDVFSDLGYLGKGHKSKILAKASVRGYNFDLVHVPDEMNNKYWLLSNMISNNRNRSYNPSTFTHFITKEDNSFLQSHFSNSDVSDIKGIRNRYDYLIAHEDGSSTKSTPSFRNHVIDWINFYRCYIFNESPVSENTDFDQIAQNGANTQSDKEDMNWGESDPEDIVTSYITDSADEDNDGTTGHRDSVLASKSAQVGIGQKSDVNALFFHWGWGDTATNPSYNIDYPKLSDFPINLAKDGEYWSIQTSLQPKDVKVTIFDRTANKYIQPNSVNLINGETYIKMDPDKLHTGHNYHIAVEYTLQDNSVSNYWYDTQLYELNPYKSSNI